MASSSRWRMAWTLAAVLLAWPVRTQSDPFAFLRPTVDITPQEERRLDAGEVLVRVLPATAGEFAVVLAARTTADGRRLVEGVRDIAALKRSAQVTAISRFSSPPIAADVAALQVDEQDLAAMRACRPRSCDLKLTAAEMETLQTAASSAGANWRPALQAAMRSLVLDRTSRYLVRGHAGIGSYADQGQPTVLADVFRTVLQHSAFLTTHAADLAGYLERYPQPAPPGVESFVYWSNEQLGGRPSLGATHVAMRTDDSPDRPEAVVVGKQIFATHYVTGALSVTAVLRGRESSERYLVYVNRSRVDVLDRWYGGLARTLMTRRIRDEATRVFRGLKERLERGMPPT
jgi:hypothetical protein